MKKLLLLCTFIACTATGYAQHALRLTVKSADEKTPLAGATATIGSINKTAVADSVGTVLLIDLPAGTYTVTLSYTGMESKALTVQVPQPDSAATDVFLTEGEEEEEIIISTTRTSRGINDIPTRVETISGEELSEKAAMKPGDIRMLLNESTGIQTQQTSATSANAGIRIQGLDGRYTQLLRDGFPLYAGFSGGLSLLQIAPLDLQQVEVIKGSASTLYGGGAIAGLVNLVSKVPQARRETSFMANGTSAGGLDLSGFYSQRIKQLGFTVFGSGNWARPYDPARIGFTAIPKYSRYTISPRLFMYADKTTANIGVSYTTERRTGGSLAYIKRGEAGYFETNATNRVTTQAEVRRQLTAASYLQLKSSYSVFNRVITIPGYAFEGRQQASYSELTFNATRKQLVWIGGLNVITDNLAERPRSTAVLRSYHYTTVGAFVQNTFSPAGHFSMETGLRADYTKPYGVALLPRLSAMLKLTPQLTVRAGGGLGYKIPTVFTEDAERIQFRNLLPVNQQTAHYERSAGGNLDVNYRTRLGAVGLAFNQLFFYTRLNGPLVLSNTVGGNTATINAAGTITTKGAETNLRLTYNQFKLFVGYTHAQVSRHFNNTSSQYPLTPRHRLNNVLMYEQEGRLKIGLEAYYFSAQPLSDGATGKAYWIAGLMAEKLWRTFSVFINFENFLDARQTRFDTIYTGPASNPVFRDIYAPVDGFVVNGGLKLRL